MVKPNGKDCAEFVQSYRGVRKRKWGKWVSEIRLPNSRERIWLGSHDTPEKAARAFDAALFCLRGKNANFNFPENPPEILNGQSMKPSEIQVAAARFANGWAGPRECSDLSSSPSSEKTEITLSNNGFNEMFREVSLESEKTKMTLDNGFMDMFSSLGTINDMSDFEIFSGFDDLSGDFFIPPQSSSLEENYLDYDGFQSQGSSFLWNF
ncbi:unnamed protein product [Withania somnifera]